jgi:monoamine oxidase
VVGAGLAGIAAARAVERGGASAVLVEARDRVGGRLESVAIDEGKWVDVGGQWIGPTQHRVEALARSLGHQTFPTYASGENLVEFGGKLIRYTGTIPRLGPHVLADIGQAMLRLNRMASKVPRDSPWTAPRAKQWDSQTTWSWMRHNMATSSGRTMLELAVKAVWAAMPADVSLLHLLFYISSAGTLELLLDTEGGAQQDRFVGGSQLVPIRMAEELGEERLVLGAPVRRIEHSGDGVTVHADGNVLRGRRAILALAPTLAARIAYEPALPGFRDQLTQRMPLGTVAKCMAIYDEPFWRAEGLSGQGTSERGPVRLTFDNSPPDGSPGVLLGFLEGRRARELGRLPEEERRSAVIDCFTRMFGPRARAPDAYVERLWAEEEWTRGCYGCHMPTGAWTNYGPALHPPIGALHWAGAEYAHVWNGYMDGAVRSGEAAAAEVVEVL